MVDKTKFILNMTAFNISIVIATPNSAHSKFFKRISKDFLCSFRNKSLSPKRLSNPIPKFKFVIMFSKIVTMKPNTANIPLIS